MSERYEPPDVPGVTWGVWDVAYHGPFREYVFPGRRVLAEYHDVPLEWTYEPEKCPDEDIKGEWICGGQVLVCPSCGLDCT